MMSQEPFDQTGPEPMPYVLSRYDGEGNIDNVKVRITGFQPTPDGSLFLHFAGDLAPSIIAPNHWIALAFDKTELQTSEADRMLNLVNEPPQTDDDSDNTGEELPNPLRKEYKH